MVSLRAVDLFCGAGGSTTGAIAAGVDVVLAVNHWRTAITSHQQNHPGIRHICARIEHIDARNDRTLPDFDLLMASPECTHHSIARGGKPVSDQSRQQPFALLDWIDAKRPRWCVIENVREFQDWGPLRNTGTERRPVWHPDPKRKGETFRAWVTAIKSIGYSVEWSILNAADFGEATKRNRLFVIARRGRGGQVPFPAPTHAGKWRPAAEIIDWSRPCPSIFTRKRPLAEKTLRRIEVGLRKFVGGDAEPFIVHLRGTSTTMSCGSPVPTVTAGGRHVGLCVPFQFKALDRSAGVSRSIDEPVPTIVAARENHAVVMPFLLPRQGYFDCHKDKPAASIDDPLNTVTANHCPAHVVMPFLTDVNHGGEDGRCHGVNAPLGTVTTKRGTSLVLPFLTHYYGTGGASAVTEPLVTVTTKDRFGLAMASLVKTMQELRVVDIGFRMLDVDELAAAMGFPSGYYLHGTKAEQIKQVGNAVCPGVMKAICETIAA
jgi:DNA (cytosine-5)-methyltransferase 1